MFTITTEDVPGNKIKVLIATGMMDGKNTTHISAKIKEEVDKGCYNFIVDMSQVIFFNSAGIMDLLWSKEYVKTYKGKVKFIGFSEHLLSILDLLGFLKILEIYDNREECIKSFSNLLNADCPPNQ